MPLRRTRVLLGHMPLADADKFLRGRSPDVPGDPADFKAAWQAARDAVAERDPPDLDPQPQPLKASRHADRLVKQPAFKEAVSKHHWSLKTVRIDALLSVQRRVDEGYATKSTEGATPDDAKRTLAIALPLAREPRPLTTIKEPKSISVSTVSPDLRLVGPTVSHDPATDRTSFGFTVGWGSPFVTVSHLAGRYYLKNGYHRVFGFRARGVERVPAVVVEAKRLEDTGAARPGFFGAAQLVNSERPPTLASFFDDAASASVRVPTMRRVFRVTVEEATLLDGEGPAEPTSR